LEKVELGNFGIAISQSPNSKISKFQNDNDDKKLFQDRIAQSSEEQNIFFHKHFWIGNGPCVFHADRCFCLQ
jgi:hypothetical protein